MPEWLPILDRVAQSGKPERFERRAISSGRWQDYQVFPAGSGKDRIGILSSDFTSRKLAEDALRDSEAKFRAIANTSPVIIWMSDADSRVVFVNQPWLDFTGQSLESALGEGWSHLIHPEDLPVMLSIYERARGRQEVFYVDFRLRRADGEYRSFVSTCAPRVHGDGSFAGYAGSSIDVTERRQAEEALATINQRLADAQEDERARIARELHDDVVQRLVGLGWRLGAVRDPSPVPASEGATQEIDDVRAEIMSLAKDVQALSHRLHPAWLEFLGIAAAVRALCREMSRHSGVEIVCQVDNIPDGLSRENAICLHRVLQEALQNAVKHSHATKVEVSLRSVLCEVEMTVRDFGVGFDPGARVHPGLGLTSMKERLKSVGGRLSITSQPDGTTIQAYVPIAPAEPDKPA
jgi:PAS domain S-box-containing protein